MLDFLLGNDLLLSIVAFALVLIPAIIIHELGHFLTAKAVGITILEFGIGFPPFAMKLFRWGETDVTLNWLPIGGFVRPLGEDLIRPLGEEEVERDRQKLQGTVSAATMPVERDLRTNTDLPLDAPEPVVDPLQQEREQLRAQGIEKIMSVNEARPLARIFFMAGGALANFLSAFAIFILIGLMGIPEVVGGRITLVNVNPDSALAETGLQTNDLIEDLNGQKFTSSEEFFDKLSALRGQSATLTVLRPETNNVFDIEVTPTDDMLPTTQLGYIHIVGVAEDSPAEKAGILPDDRVVALNGESITAADDPVLAIQQFVAENAGKSVTLTLLRDGQEVEVSLVPRVSFPPNEGSMGIGLNPEYHFVANDLVYADGPAQIMLVSQSPGKAIEYGVDQVGTLLVAIVEVPGRILRGTLSPEAARPVSVVGISQWGGQVLEQSIEESQPAIILNYIAIISVLLGITNLLPLPALDGGRIVFVLLEVVRGRPIAPEREGLIHLIGFAFMLSIGLLFILNDIINPLPSIMP